MSWGDAMTSLLSAGINYAMGSSDPSGSAIPLTVKRFEPRLQRAALTTIIQLALFGLEPVGSKLNFIDNALSFDPPTYSTSAKRTAQSWMDAKSGASRDSLPDLNKDFMKAKELYVLCADNEEDLKAIQNIFFHAIKGLDLLDQTYPDTLVKEFTDKARSIFNDIIALEFQVTESFERSEVDRIQLSLYTTNEIKVVSETLDLGKDPAGLLKVMTQQKILAWQAAINEYLFNKFK